MVRSLLFAFALTTLAPGQDTTERADAWREDLAALAREFPQRHKNAFHQISANDWSAAVHRLHQAIPDLTDDQIEVGLLKLIASVGDSHSSITNASVLHSPSVPLRLHWWADGIRVSQTTRAHSELLGQKLVSIAGLAVEELREAIAEIEVLENEALTWMQVPRRILSPRLLYALDLIDDPLGFDIELESDAGEITERWLEPAATARLSEIARPTTSRVTDETRHWHQATLLDDNLLYVQYNRCMTSEAYDFNQFATELLQQVEEVNPPAIIFDLQYNGGGNSMFGTMLFAQLALHPPMKQRQQVYCIVGRRTFSSAILNAMELKQHFNATLVGEPTGGSPNHFGEIRSLQLPNSGLDIRYSTKYFRRSEADVHTIEPDHLIRQTYAQAMAGDDPVIDWIRAQIGEDKD